ncbi:MAG TPA: hypothetical protein VK796_10100 [Cytophaga sp.]|jgi:hypothetical protein|nr:hypothetical protein [Cytophaga sp.]
MIEKDTVTLYLVISNLKNFSSKADSLQAGKSKTISYPDFFDQYREYIVYLKSLDFERKEITELLSNAPKIPTTGFSLMKLMIIIPFVLCLFAIQIYLLMYFILVPLLMIAGIFFFTEVRRKCKMSEIITFNSRLVNLLQVKLNED